MRYMPNQYTQNTSRRFDRGARPADNLISEGLLDLIVERDRIGEALSLAQTHANELAAESNDAAAKLADDTAATTAARAGKPVPPAVATRKLAEDREVAAREFDAQRAAYAAVTDEAETLAGELHAKGEPAAIAARTKARTRIEALANKLADEVEAVVKEGAAHDWLRTMHHATAETWAVDVAPDLSREGLHRGNTKPVPVRSLITRAALAVLEEEGQS